jgi:hypothetical protein
MKKLQAMSESIEDTVQVYSPGADNQWRLKHEKSVYGPTSSPSPVKYTPDKKPSRPALARLDRPYYSGGQLGRRGYNTRIDEREEEDLIREIRRTRRTRVYVDPDAEYTDDDEVSSLPHHEFASRSESRAQMDAISEDDPFTQPVDAVHFRNGALNEYHGQQITDGLHSLAAVAANSNPVVSTEDSFYNTNSIYSQQHQQSIPGCSNRYALHHTIKTPDTNISYPIMPESQYRYIGQQGSNDSQPGHNAQFEHTLRGNFEPRNDINGFAPKNTLNTHGVHDHHLSFNAQRQFNNRPQYFQHGDSRSMPLTFAPNHIRTFSNGTSFGNGTSQISCGIILMQIFPEINHEH